MPENDRAALHAFWALALKSPAELLERIVPPDEVGTKYATFDANNARDYFLLKALIEVQTTGFVYKRWDGYLDNLAAEPDRDAPPVQQTLASLTDEQSLWRRKLIEILVACIGFSDCEATGYFHHYLLLQTLEQYQSMLKDQRSFFGERSLVTQRAAAVLEARIAEVAGTLERPGLCWYLNSGDASDPREPTRMASFATTLKRALERATDFEKRALAYTYSMGFGASSEDIHFSPLRRMRPDLANEFHFAVSQCGLLIVAIVLRAHTLMGLEPPKGLQEGAERDPGSVSPVDKPIEVGDFVMAGGPFLGRVAERKQGPFGYAVFRVRYLANPPVPGIEEDWVPSHELGLYVAAEKMRTDVMSLLREHAGPRADALSPEDLDDSVLQAVTDMWQMGLNEFMRKRFATLVRRTPTLGHDIVGL